MKKLMPKLFIVRLPLMNVNNQEENKKLSKVFIISLFFVCILITALIVCAFFFSEDKFVITKSIITLLCLLVLLVPTEKDADKYNDTEKLKEWFAPAIQSGLLEIKNIEYSKADYDSCLIERNKK